MGTVATADFPNDDVDSVPSGIDDNRSDQLAPDSGSTANPSPDHSQLGGRPGGVSRRILVACLAVPAAGLPLVGSSGVGVAWTLLTATGLLAAAVVGGATQERESSQIYLTRRLSVVGSLPGAFLLLAFAAICLAQLSSISGANFLQTRAGALSLWMVLCLGALVVGMVRGGRVSMVRGDVPAAATATAMWVLGVVVAALQPLEIWTRNVSGGTDFTRHLIFIRQLLSAGGLEYTNNDYPRGIHSLIAVNWSAAGGTRFQDAWMAQESSLWLMLCLMVLALAVVVGRVAIAVSLSKPVRFVLLPVVLFVGFIQSMWITAMLYSGFVTSIFAGLVVAAILSQGLDGRWLGSPRSLAFLAIGGALLVHTWTLLAPLVAAAFVVAVLAAVRQRRRPPTPRALDWGIAVFVSAAAAVSCFPPVLALIRSRTSDGDLSSDLSASGYSGLTLPNLWWVAFLLLAILGLVLTWRAGFRGYVALWVTFGIAGAVLVVGLLLLGGLRRGEPSYYAAKSMWTMSLLVVPFTVVALGWALQWGFSKVAHLRSGIPRLAGVAVLGLILTLLVAGVVGRWVGTPSVVGRGLSHGMAGIPYQIPVVTALEDKGVKATANQGVLSWGISPYATVQSLRFSAGFADLFAREATTWQGFRGLQASNMGAALFGRKSDIACDFLRQNPDALRVTGPNPASGSAWLVAGGCPEDIVKPQEWVAAPIPSAWFERSFLEDQPYTYPSFGEYQNYLQGKPAR